MCKYLLRPPIAQERIKRLADGLVRIELKRPFRDGTVAVDVDPLSLLCRLAAAVPPPKMHLVRYAGVLSAAHKWRPKVVPPLPTEADDDRAHSHAHTGAAKPPTHRSGYWPWARLMKRSLGIDADKCDTCGSRMKLRALVRHPATIERILRHRNEPTQVLPLSPARGPPFFTSRAVRRKMGELDAPLGQTEMFGA
jgi:hypothetical protein